MDSATRNFLGLLGTSIVVTAYVACGFVASILLPFLAVAGAPPLLGTLAATAVATLLALAARRGLRAGRRQVRAARRLAAQVAACRVPTPPELRAVAAEMELEGRLELIGSQAPFSFVHGLLAPRVAISEGFLAALAEDELRAVLAHERYHVRKLEPLRATIGTVLVEAFFLVPSFGALRDRYLRGRELAAEREARRSCGTRPLGGALLKAVEGPAWQEPTVSASLGGDDALLAARIDQLETGRAPRAGGSFAGLGTSVLGALAFVGLFGAAVFGLGGAGAMHELAARELSVGGTLLGAACLAPLALAVGLAYRHLANRARRALPTPGHR